MLKKIKNVLCVICMAIFLSHQALAQEKRPDGKGQQHAPAARPVTARPVAARPVSHNNQNKRQAPTRSQAPRQPISRPEPVVQARTFQPVRQERTGPRVYAVPEVAPVVNNRLLNRQHHNHWQPRYNFYNNQYHFYPYVNIASTVELTGGGVLAPFNGQNYYYDQGTFYVQDASGQYEAVEPPVGIIVNPIAANARQINVDAQAYWRYKGVFYVQVAGGYQVIAPVQPVPADS